MPENKVYTSEQFKALMERDAGAPYGLVPSIIAMTDLSGKNEVIARMVDLSPTVKAQEAK